MSASPSTNSQVCNYQTVTIKAGEQFTLPPGAVIVSATNPNAITSTCPIDSLETPQCYGFYFHESVANDNTGFGDTILEGIQINNIKYPFDTPITVDIFDFCDNCVPTALVNTFENAVLTTTIGGAFSNFAGFSDDWDESGDRANIYVLCFKTIPSLATNAYIYGYGNSNGPNINVLWPITKPSAMPLDPRMYANCPC